MCASCSSTIAAGTSHNDSAPRFLALQCKGTDQASAALVTDLKQRGPARRHAGSLGRGIRPHRPTARAKLTETNYGPRSPTRGCFTHVDGRRRRQEGLHFRRGTDRLLFTTWSPIPSTSHEPCRRRSSVASAFDHLKLTYKFQGPPLSALPTSTAAPWKEILG